MSIRTYYRKLGVVKYTIDLYKIQLYNDLFLSKQIQTKVTSERNN